MQNLCVWFVFVQHMGQVYIPVFNYILMVLCVVVVIGFQTSTAMTHAYGESSPALISHMIASDCEAFA